MNLPDLLGAVLKRQQAQRRTVRDIDDQIQRHEREVEALRAEEETLALPALEEADERSTDRLVDVERLIEEKQLQLRRLRAARRDADERERMERAEEVRTTVERLDACLVTADHEADALFGELTGRMNVDEKALQTLRQREAAANQLREQLFRVTGQERYRKRRDLMTALHGAHYERWQNFQKAFRRVTDPQMATSRFVPLAPVPWDEDVARLRQLQAHQPTTEPTAPSWRDLRTRLEELNA